MHKRDELRLHVDEIAPSVWGANEEYMHLDRRTVLHPVSSDLPASLPVMYNPIGAGVRWAYRAPATNPDRAGGRVIPPWKLSVTDAVVDALEADENVVSALHSDTACELFGIGAAQRV